MQVAFNLLKLLASVIIKLVLEKPIKPLTYKEYREEKVGICCGCGCSCAYVIYTDTDGIVDLYGHPADIRGMGSLCTKGIAYIQETQKNPLRLKGIYLKEGGDVKSISLREAKDLLKERLKKRTAFLLGRQTSLEDYFIAYSVGDVFVDAPVVNFKPSNTDFWKWKDYKLILSVDAEPVFSEVMSTRYLVDAVEKGAFLVCISSRFETICAKAKKRYLLTPSQMVELLEGILDIENQREDIAQLRKLLYVIKDSLIIVGAHLLNSPYRNRILRLISSFYKKFGTDYSIVGDVMPFPAKQLGDFSPESYENVIVIGNLLKLLPKETLQELKEKFVVHLTLFPDYTSHLSNLVIGTKNFTERDFINYRHGFGYTTFSPKTLEGDGFYTLSDLLDIHPNLEDYRTFKPLEMEPLYNVELPEGEPMVNGIWIHTENTLVEDLGHWYVWLHDMEKYQMAYVNQRTYRELGLKGMTLEIMGSTLALRISPKVADGVIFIPRSFDEYQPFDEGLSPNSFMKKPYMSYEVLK